MTENQMQRTEGTELDMRRVLRAVWKRAWLILLVGTLCAAIALAAAFFLITPRYESSAMFYVNNHSRLSGDREAGMSSDDLSTSRKLVDSYLIILNTQQTLSEVKEAAGSDRSCRELQKMIRAEAVNETEIFRVTVTSHDPAEALKIADAIVTVLPERISAIIEDTSVKIVEMAMLPEEPSAPSYLKSGVIGALLGLVLMGSVVAFREIFDLPTRSEEKTASKEKN